jgi:hypothetical protein
MILNKTKSPISFRFAAFAIAAALVSLLTTGTLEARLVGQAEAWTVAARLLEFENARPDLRLTHGLFELDRVELMLYHNRPVGYLIRLKPGGFMILADITEVSPQVFVSYEGNPDLLTVIPYLISILDRLEYNKVHLHYLNADGAGDVDADEGDVPDPVMIKRNEQCWSNLGREDIPAAARAVESKLVEGVAPLLTSKWGQGEPYWNDTPRVGGQPTVTGCGATAMAQVMYYWKYPARGIGNHAYHWKGQTLSADFNHQYDWDQMLDSYSGSYTASQADAVARLMSDVGIAIDMNYGVDNSWSYLNDNDALQTFFKYSWDLSSSYSDLEWDAWFKIIRRQMDIHRPVLMHVYRWNGSHFVVADGYRTSPSNQVHVNMGWDGYADNYYSLQYIYHFKGDFALIDIHPSPDNCLLTIRRNNNWGTTTPAPGAYSYAYSANVQVTATPAEYTCFTRWTGSETGTTNPVIVLMTQNKTITANFLYIYAPVASGEKAFNRSFSQGEYVDKLSWTNNDNNADLTIGSYKIYSVSGSTNTLLTTVGADQTQYYRHNAGAGANQYAISAVTSAGGEGAPALITVQ